MDAEDILDGLIQGALSSRGKTWQRTGHAVGRSGSLVNAKTLLAAAGVAWGLYEAWQSQQGAKSPGGLPPGPAGTSPPPLPGTTAPALLTPAASAAPSLPEPVSRIVRLMVSAARADGDLGPAERQRILEQARAVGAEAAVAAELEAPRPLAEIVAGVNDPNLKADLYTLAFSVVRADETVTGGERIYLAQLAYRLGLDADTVARLEARAAAHIDPPKSATGA